METKTLITTLKTEYKCEKCPSGFFEFTGREYETFPVQYAHSCNNCEEEQLFLLKYPITEIIETTD